MSAANFILNNPVIVLDGGTGTELQRSHGFQLTAPLWSSEALTVNPAAVRDVHEAYLNAGAQIITTATFRSGTSAYELAGRTAGDARSDTILAVTLARQAIARTDAVALVAGSIAPIFDCYGTELPSLAVMKRDHFAQAEALVAGGVDFILLETVPTITEAKIMVAACEQQNAPFAVSFTVGNDGRLLDKSLLSEAARATESENRIAIGVNCSRIGDAALAVDELIGTGYKGAIILYPNGISDTEGPDEVGKIGNELGWKFGEGLTRDQAAERFVEAAIRLVQHAHGNGNQVIIGGCCGVTPVEIRALADELAGARRHSRFEAVDTTAHAEPAFAGSPHDGACCPQHVRRLG